MRDWARKNPEKVRANSQRNYQRHKERFKASASEWRKRNLDKVSKIMVFQNAKRRSRQAANGGRGFTKAHWLEILRRFDEMCAYCRGAKANSIDHFQPIKLGGQHDFSNIVPACRKCNTLKRDQEPTLWVIREYGDEALQTIRGLMLA